MSGQILTILLLHSHPLCREVIQYVQYDVTQLAFHIVPLVSFFEPIIATLL